MKTPGRCKEKRLCHINMLKLYHARQGEDPSRAVCTVATEASEMTIKASPKQKNSQIHENLTPKLAHLLPRKQKDMEQLLSTYYQLFPHVPGCTTHDVDVGTARPCKQHPYRVNPIKVQHLKAEINMLQNKIIEPSRSN